MRPGGIDHHLESVGVAQPYGKQISWTPPFGTGYFVPEKLERRPTRLRVCVPRLFGASEISRSMSWMSRTSDDYCEKARWALNHILASVCKASHAPCCTDLQRSATTAAPCRCWCTEAVVSLIPLLSSHIRDAILRQRVALDEEALRAAAGWICARNRNELSEFITKKSYETVEGKAVCSSREVIAESVWQRSRICERGSPCRVDGTRSIDLGQGVCTAGQRCHRCAK